MLAASAPPVITGARRRCTRRRSPSSTIRRARPRPQAPSYPHQRDALQRRLLHWQGRRRGPRRLRSGRGPATAVATAPNAAEAQTAHRRRCGGELATTDLERRILAAAEGESRNWTSNLGCESAGLCTRCKPGCRARSSCGGARCWTSRGPQSPSAVVLRSDLWGHRLDRARGWTSGPSRRARAWAYLCHRGSEPVGSGGLLRLLPRAVGDRVSVGDVAGTCT